MRPKGSKNKAKAPETKTMTKEETAEWYLKDAERMKKRYSPENTELVERAQFVAPGFTEEMAKRGVWLKQIEGFCEKKGFTPSELIEKFELLERDNSWAKDIIAQHLIPEIKPETAPQSGIFIPDSPYGPDTAPEMEKRIQDTPQFKMGRQKAENGSKRENIYAPGGAFSKLGEKTPEISPETGLPHDPSKNQERGKEGSENGAVNDWIKEAGGPFNALNTVRQQENDKKLKTKEEMPAGLSKTDMLKWHRNNK